ncbi:hypothetical protein ACS0TY_014089 [Phlomoides rotata]
MLDGLTNEHCYFLAVYAFWEGLGVLTNGRVNARLKCDLTNNLTLKANAQLTNEPHMSHGMFNFDYKVSVKFLSSGIWLSKGIYGPLYVYNIKA